MKKKLIKKIYIVCIVGHDELCLKKAFVNKKLAEKFAENFPNQPEKDTHTYIEKCLLIEE